MDDSCAVCAETLEWVAYGPCGHREVCSTCVSRLRFICNDNRCCICKAESTIVFATKALGEYTRMINDFSTFPSAPREGRAGSYCFHEDTHIFFDDVDHYKMIKAMCRLACRLCDGADEQSDVSKLPGKFRNVEQLKGHLFHQHRLLMCSLCLEGRKVFICEQKLYSRKQLTQHIKSGDSEVDGSEGERGGFMGHPVCEFCKSTFYGDNELYSHMSTEHYTCHFCQRQNPGRYEYYKAYDELEVHFRQAHFLCEDEACLSKKFVVFLTEMEMKRHLTLEHGGNMPRCKRNVALKIPTSFRYQRSNENEDRRGRERTFCLDLGAETETSQSRTCFASSSNSQVVVPNFVDEASDIFPSVRLGEQPLPADRIDVSSSSKYLEALGRRSSPTVTLEASSFPPLPSSSGAGSSSSSGGQQKSKPRLARAQHQKPRDAARASLEASSFPPLSLSVGPPELGCSSSTRKWAAANGTSPPPLGRGTSQPGSSGGLASISPMRSSPVSPSYAASFSWNLKSNSAERSVKSTANSQPASSPLDLDFPPISAGKAPPATPPGERPRHPVPSPLAAEDIHAANKILVEKIRAALNHNKDKFSSFKDISGWYRDGSITADAYLDYARQFGLLHLVPDLASLCPDVQKQKDLLDSYNASSRIKDSKKNCWAKNGRSLADDMLNTVRALQINCDPRQRQLVETLSKDGYRYARG